MISYKTQDLLLETSGLIIHGCNRMKAYNSGVAGQIRQKYPKAYKSYLTLFDFNPPMLGTVQFVKINNELYVGNCITQETYGRDPKVKYADPSAIKTSLEVALQFCKIHKILLKSPKIGCGLGGLDWSAEILPIYSELSNKHNTTIEIYQL